MSLMGILFRLILTKAVTESGCTTLDCFEAKQNNRSAKQAKYFNITEDQVVCNRIKAREILKDKIGQQHKLFLKVYSVDHSR